jgi:protein-L-isoaspartate(D-aspartate) O-methyltransferase
MSRDFAVEREKMVDLQIRARGINDRNVLRAMTKIPRHLFVPKGLTPSAYQDEPLPIGSGQTISQPYIVAYMTETLELKNDDRVLEIGTGSGYQTAVLADIAKEVFTVEILDGLSVQARDVLSRLGYSNIRFHVGDGAAGWPEFAPYNKIIVTAAAPRIPEALEKQLDAKGRMICPVGTDFQELIRVVKRRSSLKRESLLAVRFVPLVSPH